MPNHWVYRGLEVSVFSALALGVSWTAFYAPWFDGAMQSLRWPLIMWGPGLAALICSCLFSKDQPALFDLWGPRPGVCTCLWASACIVLSWAHTMTSGFAAGVLMDTCRELFFGSFSNILGEEMGWRGYLEERFKRWFGRYWPWVMGILWEGWHLPFRFAFGSPTALSLATGVLCMVAASYVLSAIYARTQSLMVVVAVHLATDYVLQWRQAPVAVGFAVWLCVLTRVIWVMGRAGDRQMTESCGLTLMQNISISTDSRVLHGQ